LAFGNKSTPVHKEEQLSVLTRKHADHQTDAYKIPLRKVGRIELEGGQGEVAEVDPQGNPKAVNKF
jgi:hypothetical protein